MLSLLWGVPLIGVNHCVGHIEMGRVATKQVPTTNFFSQPEKILRQLMKAIYQNLNIVL